MSTKNGDIIDKTVYIGGDIGDIIDKIVYIDGDIINKTVYIHGITKGKKVKH